ncbi:MAG: sulfotransferase domain-containing protein, partial [Acidimicrobiia bacterium]
LLIFGRPEPPAPLSVLSPWLDMQIRPLDEVLAHLEGQRHRRFVKTHTPLDGLPFLDEVTYIVVGRDPRDTGISWAHHMGNLDFGVIFAAREAAVGTDDLAELMPEGHVPLAESVEERFWQWVDDDAPQTVGSLMGMIGHLRAAWARRDRPNVVLLHYRELSTDLAGELRRLAVCLGVGLDEDRQGEFLEAASLSRMRDRVDAVIPNWTEKIWIDTARFLRQGTSGQWKAMLGEDGRARYRARLAELGCDGDPVCAWLHDEPA